MLLVAEKCIAFKVGVPSKLLVDPIRLLGAPEHLWKENKDGGSTADLHLSTSCACISHP